MSTKLAFLATLLSTAIFAQRYSLGPDSQRHDGVPHGTATKFTWVSRGGMYPGVERDYWVYVPAQYNASKPACLMVFQDGAGS